MPSPPLAPAQEQLRAPAVLRVLCSTMGALTQPPPSGPPSTSTPPAPPLRGLPALWGAANLTLLVAGQSSSLALPGAGGAGQRGVVRVLQDAPHLRDPSVAAAFCRAGC